MSNYQGFVLNYFQSNLNIDLEAEKRLNCTKPSTTHSCPGNMKEAKENV